MMDAEKRDRGLLRVDVEECKGCGLVRGSLSAEGDRA